jgi:hypothetical protein
LFLSLQRDVEVGQALRDQQIDILVRQRPISAICCWFRRY